MIATADTVSTAPSNARRRLRELTAEARMGAREAQYELGLMYANGVGVKQDLKEAVAWVGKAADKGLAAAQYVLATQYAAGKDDRAMHTLLLRAAEQGHARAIHRLGKLYESAQPHLAFAQMRKAAELGLAEAQWAVGQAFVRGQGVDADMPSAAQWLQKAAEQGLAAAQHDLAALHAEGRCIGADPSIARQWYRRAAAQDHAPAIVALAALDDEGGGRRVEASRSVLRPDVADRRRDVRRWSKLADPGDADSRYHLGLMFERGIEVTAHRGKAKSWYSLAARQGDARAQAALASLLEATEPELALDWYRRSADQGNRSAQSALGRLCSSRGGGPADAFQGLQWYSRAAQGGDALALLTLGHLFTHGQEDVAHECFRRAADQGVAQAQFAVGRRFESGIGVNRDAQLAAHWYGRAAAQGDAQAQCALGVCHLHGHGVMQDAAQAFHWFQRAADQGDAQAQWNLGALYASGGDGIEQDLRRAFAWCRKSADQGFAAAKATLGLLHMRMDQPEQAFALWREAAGAGDGEAQYNLAQLFAKGQGCRADPRAAFNWFSKAAERGIAPAQSRLALLYATGDGVALDSIEAHKWFVIASRSGDAAARANRKHSESQLNALQIEEAERRASAWNVYRQAANASPADARMG